MNIEKGNEQDITSFDYNNRFNEMRRCVLLFAFDISYKLNTLPVRTKILFKTAIWQDK